MKFIQRLGYYLGGFSIGLIILVVFLNNKNASCDYGPNARTVKNIASKKIVYADNILNVLETNAIDSIIVKQLIQFGDVDFSESDTKSEPCKTYHIDNIYKERDVVLKVENCESIAKVIDFKFLE